MKEKSVVIFVHGIGANENEWWGTTKNSLLGDREIPLYIERDFWGYDTEKITKISNRILNVFGKGTLLADFCDIGTNLLEYIRTNHSDKDNIILYGHSMGGLIVSSALLQSKENDVDIKGIVLCGTPLDGSKLIVWYKKIFQILWIEWIYNLFQSKHTLLLTKEYGVVTEISEQLKTIVTLDRKNTTKPLLTFVKIIDDTVVATNQERFGPFIEDINKNKRLRYTLKGNHVNSIVNLSVSNQNYKNIKNWILEAFNISPYSNDKDEIYLNFTSAIKKELSNICSREFFANLSYESKLNIGNNLVHNDERFKLVSHRDREDAYERLKANYTRRQGILQEKEYVSLQEEEKYFLERSYITIKKTFCKTYLFNGMYILDINNKIEILDGAKNCIIKFYHGFDDDNCEYHKKEWREKLLIDLKKNYQILEDNTSGVTINRFNDKTFLAKIKDSDGNLDNIKNECITYSLHETNVSKGVLITIDLGTQTEGSIFEIMTSITLPSETTDDKLTFINTAVTTEIVVQEEIYGSSLPKLNVEVRRGIIKLDFNDKDKKLDLYYSRFFKTLMYNDKNSSDLTISIVKNH